MKWWSRYLAVVLFACAGADDVPGPGHDGAGNGGSNGADDGGSGGKTPQPECDPSDPRCWCPNEPCSKYGCFEGMAYNCTFYGDCGDQREPIDCAADGLTCWWSTTHHWFECDRPGCGDAVVQEWEECDEGVRVNGTRPDGCSSDCTLTDTNR